MVLEPPEGNPHGHGHGHAQPSSLEALLAGQMNFPAMLDIPPDADDETMVELAIALSLQDQVFVVFCTLNQASSGGVCRVWVLYHHKARVASYFIENIFFKLTLYIINHPKFHLKKIFGS